MSQILAPLQNIEYPFCANFYCQNRLTDFEVNKTTRFGRRSYCRQCRMMFALGRIYANRCHDCGVKIQPEKWVCFVCRKTNRFGHIYINRKCAYRNCKKIIPRTADGRKKYCCKSHCNVETQMRYKERRRCQ